MGVGIIVAFVIVSLVIAWKSGNHRLGQAVYYIFVGLVLSSLAPGFSQASHDFITNVSNSITQIDFSK